MMPTLTMPRRSRTTRLLAVLGLGVAVGSLAWLAVKGIQPLGEGVSGWLDEFGLEFRDALGLRGPLALAYDAIQQGLVLALTVVLAALQLVLSLLLARAALAAWLGDASALWSMRAWAWCTLGVDAVFLLTTGGMDPLANVRLVLAILLLIAVQKPPDPAFVSTEPPAPEPSQGQGDPS